MLPAERKTWLRLIAWKTMTMATRPRSTGSTPLSPPLMRPSVALHVVGKALRHRPRRARAAAAPSGAAVRSTAASAGAARFAGGDLGMGVRRCHEMPPSRLSPPGRHSAPPVVMYSTTLWRSKVDVVVLHDHPPEVEDRDPVSDREDVVEVVRDDHHGQAAVAQPPDQVEHHAGLRDTEGRGRLVHDDELGVPHHGLGDGHRLSLPTGERADRLPDRADRGDAQAGECLRSGSLHVVLVEQTVPQSLAPQEHVLDDVEVVGEGEVLIDGLDAERGGVRGRCGCAPADPPSRSDRGRAGWMPEMCG